MLCLGELVGMTEDQILDHMADVYEVKRDELVGYTVLVAYERNEDYEASNWFLVCDSTGELYDNEGGHCSCNGFEDQWDPIHTSVKTLLARNYFSGGHEDRIKEYVRTLPQNTNNRRHAAVMATRAKYGG